MTWRSDRRLVQGARFGRLVFVGPGSKKAKALFRCDCGTDKEIWRSTVLKGESQSCGCYRRARVTKHGARETREWDIWSTLVQRCTNPKNKAFPEYGGRGITVCDRWRDSFEAFLNDMGPRPSPRHSVDRIENHKGYAPGNCRWATPEQQQRNKRNNHMVTAFGETKCLAAFCEEKRAPYQLVLERLRRGWDAERALTTSAGERRRAA